MDAGHEIYITTTRPELLKDQIKLENRDLWKVVNDLGIKHENVRFTNGTGKYHFLHDFDIHFDDDRIEIELIEEHLTTCVGVLIFDP